ncbi:hypothetical protein PR048_030880 [Dryococelus australis]|uniref:Uncharacterized protein n=1 Tax=Dryococelus australis TaxID=614101 RepID=A0ABQ9GCQ4_9NEOP|nr:hypothetical protein PR048_030880 [Dryococelus australis]
MSLAAENIGELTGPSGLDSNSDTEWLQVGGPVAFYSHNFSAPSSLRAWGKQTIVDKLPTTPPVAGRRVGAVAVAFGVRIAGVDSRGETKRPRVCVSPPTARSCVMRVASPYQSSVVRHIETALGLVSQRKEVAGAFRYETKVGSVHHGHAYSKRDPRFQKAADHMHECPKSTGVLITTPPLVCGAFKVDLEKFLSHCTRPHGYTCTPGRRSERARRARPGQAPEKVRFYAVGALPGNYLLQTMRGGVYAFLSTRSARLLVNLAAVAEILIYIIDLIESHVSTRDLSHLEKKPEADEVWRVRAVGTAGFFGRPSRPTSHGERRLPPLYIALISASHNATWPDSLTGRRRPAYQGLAMRVPIPLTGCPEYRSYVMECSGRPGAVFSSADFQQAARVITLSCISRSEGGRRDLSSSPDLGIAQHPKDQAGRGRGGRNNKTNYFSSVRPLWASLGGRPEGRAGFYCVSGLTPYAYKERKIMQEDMNSAKEGLGSHGLHFGAMNTSLSVLRDSLNYDEQGKNRQERQPTRVKIRREWSSAGMQGRRGQETPEKTRRPAASSGKILTCENPGVTRPGIEPDKFARPPMEVSGNACPNDRKKSMICVRYMRGLLSTFADWQRSVDLIEEILWTVICESVDVCAFAQGPRLPASFSSFLAEKPRCYKGRNGTRSVLVVLCVPMTLSAATLSFY